MVLISAVLANKITFSKFLRTGEGVVVGVAAAGVATDIIKDQTKKILGLRK